jgi:hypothetical protein
MSSAPCPADLLEQLVGTKPIGREAVGVLVGILREVRVKADIEPLGELGGRGHQRVLTENGEHGAKASRTIESGLGS